MSWDERERKAACRNQSATTASQLGVILNTQPQPTKQRGQEAFRGGRGTQEPGVRGAGARHEPLLSVMLLLIHPMASFNLPF